MKAAFLLALFKHPLVPMTPTEVDDFWIELDNDLVPEIDRDTALDELVEDGLIEYGGQRKSEVSLTDSGLTEVRIRSTNPKSFICGCRHGGRRWLQSMLEEIYGPTLEGRLMPLPARPAAEVDLGLQPVLQRELIGKIDCLIDAIRANNSFRISDPQNHEVVSSSLGKLKHEVTFGKTSVGRLEAMGYAALSFIATKFAESVMGTLATDVWAMITSLIHMLI